MQMKTSIRISLAEEFERADESRMILIWLQPRLHADVDDSLNSVVCFDRFKVFCV